MLSGDCHMAPGVQSDDGSLRLVYTGPDTTMRGLADVLRGLETGRHLDLAHVRNEKVQAMVIEPVAAAGPEQLAKPAPETWCATPSPLAARDPRVSSPAAPLRTLLWSAGWW